MVGVVGRKQHVGGFPDRLGRAAIAFQSVETPEGLDAGDGQAALDDGADGRVDGAGRGAQQGLDGGGALGDPGAAVEQLGRVQQRGDVDLDGDAAGRFHAARWRRRRARPDSPSTQELALVGAGHAKRSGPGAAREGGEGRE
jgi:hypothetical protein